MSSPLNVHLEQYEGPLDLLLDLIRKQQINIQDIPIARITAQYLEYVEKASELNVELSAEFVYMAATLIHIKSKMLLPRDPALAELDGEEEDPREELVQRLLEHERFKNAAEMLQQKRMVEEAMWSNPAIGEFLANDDGPGLAVSLIDLVKTLQVILDRAKHRPHYEVDQEDVGVPEMMAFLRGLLLDKPGKRDDPGGVAIRTAEKPEGDDLPVPGNPGDGKGAGNRSGAEGRFRRHSDPEAQGIRRVSGKRGSREGG